MDESENVKIKNELRTSYQESYGLPQNYFENLEDTLMGHAMNEGEKQQSSKMISMRWMMKAAMILVVLCVGYWIITDNQSVEVNAYQSDDIAYDYLMDEVDDLTLEDLAELEDIDETIRIMEEKSNY